MSRSKLKTLWWFEPRWSAAPREWRATREAFSPVACVRILLGAAAIALVIYAIIEFMVRPAMPALKFDWLKAFGLSIAGVVALMSVQFFLHLAISPIISLRAQGIVIQSGQHAIAIKHDEIKAIHVVLRRDQRHYLRIETSTGSRRIGISKRVLLAELHDRLGDKLLVHDHRDSYRCDER